MAEVPGKGERLGVERSLSSTRHVEQRREKAAVSGEMSVPTGSTLEARSSDLGSVLTVGRAAIDQQFALAERLDAKARGQVTIAGAWFAVVQAVASGAFGIPRLADTWVLVITILAAGGALLLLATMALSANVWRLRVESEIEPDGLVMMANDARSPGVDAAGKMVAHYADVLEERYVNNADRARWFKRSQRVWYGAMFVPLAELGTSFAAQALG